MKFSSIAHNNYFHYYFINRHQLIGEREVLGQVKLAFTNVNGKQMVCTRSMQFTLKKTNGTFKTLEGQLMVTDNGKRTTISTRCADLDAQMPQFLGVSKAVLDNVIFCHQEESLWPLSEPSVLKKKFDEIFEALKFTRVLDNIKVIRKDYTTDIKIQKNNTEHLKVDRDRAVRMEDKADQLVLEIDTFKEDAEKLKEEIQLITEESDRLFKSNQEFQKVIYELNSLEHENTAANDSIARMVNSIDILNETDQELEDKLTNFESQHQEHLNNQNNLRENIEQAKITLDSLQAQYHENIQKEGRLKAENNAYKNHLNERQSMLDVVAQKFGLAQSHDYTEMMTQLNGLISQHSIGLDKERARNMEKENEMNSIIGSITTEQLREEQKHLNLKATVLDAENKCRNLSREINEVKSDQGNISYSQQQLDGLQKALETEKSKLDLIEKQNKIPLLESELAKESAEKESLNRKLKQANEQISERATIKYLSDDISRRENALNSLVENYKQDFEHSGVSLSSAELGQVEISLKEKIVARTDQNKSTIQRLQNLQKEYAEKEVRLDICKKDRESIENEIQGLGDLIQPILETRTPKWNQYEELLTELEREEEFADVEHSKNMSFVTIVETGLTQAQDKHCCFLCNRNFSDDELKIFIKDMEIKLENLKNIKQNADNQAKIDARTLRDIAPSVKRLVHLQENDFPKIQKTTEQLEKDMKSLFDTKSQLESSAEEEKETLEKLEQLQEAVAQMARYKTEIMLKDQEIQQKKILISGQSQLSSEELMQLLEAVEEKIKKIRRSLDDVRDDRNVSLSQISQLQVAVSNKKSEMEQIMKRLEVKEKAEQELSLEREKITKLKTDISSIQITMDQHIKKLSEQKHELDLIKTAGAKREKEISSKINEISECINNINRITQSIDCYEASKSETDWINCQAMVSSIAEHIASIKNKQEQLRYQLNESEKSLIDLKGLKRTLEDNLALRKLRNQKKNREIRMRELEALNAEQDRIEYEKESQILSNRHARVNAQLAGKMGEIKQLDDQLHQIHTELESDYKDIKDRYRAALIKQRATVVANDDLAKYSKALEAAIMRYHTLKMAEVNEIIDELWKKTYTGSDVDTILIRSEAEASARTGGPSKYNYRVCMVKQGIELDMRGRCSAGQKVLASIIIRLALAQCFGVACGLVALDEPTTNLDHENIESLAKALSVIISTRKEQQNFQLIVITHDETFLRYMGAQSYTDHFFRVSRNERQKSRIEWVSISKIMD